MNPFQKLAYEIQRGQMLRAKTAALTADALIPLALGGGAIAAIPGDSDASDIALGAAGAAGGTAVAGSVLEKRILGELLDKGRLSGKSKAILALAAPLGYGVAQGAKHLYRDLEDGPGFNPSPAAAMSLGAGLGTPAGAGLGLGLAALAKGDRTAKAISALAGGFGGLGAGMYAGKKMAE